ncbi:MAG: NnrU family protein [Pseudomonadales bacterium]|nr:NnrU family protein [Pseudomonadales bacterium]
MNLLIVGVGIFIGIHLLPVVAPLRTLFFNALGEKGYKGLYSIIALTGFGLIVWGKAEADFVSLWVPPEWSRQLTWLMMLPAMILIVAANVPGNIKRFTPHPMMWAVFIWAISHLATNGDQASIVLMSSFAIYALIHIISANMRGAEKQTEILPFIADIKVALMGAFAYGLLLFIHPWLFRMPAF